MSIFYDKVVTEEDVYDATHTFQSTNPVNKTDKSDTQNNNIENSLYEVVQHETDTNSIHTPSISHLRKKREFGELGNCGMGMRDSLIAFKEGVPGVYSGYRLAHNKLRRKSAPVLNEHTKKSPIRPPRTNRPKSSSQLAVIYDTVHEQGGSLDLESEWLLQQRIQDMDTQHVILETGDNVTRVETGIRYYNPRTDSPTRPASTVVLPMSLDDDMSDSGDSWGSDFDESGDVEENEIYEVLGQPREKVGTVESDYEDIEGFVEKLERKKPPLPPRNSIIFESLSDSSDLEKDTYIPVEMENEQQLVQLPPLNQNADGYQVKRYQIVKCIIENEKIYMKSLNRLIKEYEEPLLDRKLISHDRVKVIFKHIHEILQCHQLFNMALSDRANEWDTREVIGDVIFASFSKSTVLKAYNSFVSNFSVAMESIKETCKLVPAFLKFLKNRLYRHNTKQSLYDLMRQPLERIPQLVILTQALVKVTPLLHPDRPPLQMALTHLECLSETLAKKRKDSMCKHKVRQLDGYFTGLDKPLASKKRYYIRHDDMLLCLVEDNKVVKTKLRRIFLLSDLIVCASILNKQKQIKLMTKKKYKVKWCLPVNDVELIDVGSGISINIDKKTTTIKYSQSISSPRPGGKNSSQLIEDLQHDIALIGEIAGKVASLRRSYRFLDTKKVNNWFKDVKNLLDRETEIANMNWIELSIPVRDRQNERMRCLFNVHSPYKKLEWSAELENVKLRLAHNNNPGWFLQEESIYDGETAVLRRTQPLVANMVPLFMIEQKYSVQCVLEVSDATIPHPMFWVFSGNEHVGLITLMEMNMTSEPHAVESFVACKARICCAELSREPEISSGDGDYRPSLLVWIGTMSGSILLFDPHSGEEKPYAFAMLKDSITTLKFSHGKMFAGLAYGTLACFQRKLDGTWNLENPTIVCLGVKSILALTEAGKKLWCACGSQIIILDALTLGIEKKIDTCEWNKIDVKHLVAYGIGVWVSSWKSSKLQLYHAETLEHLQTINITTPISRMKSEIDGKIQSINIEKIYVSALLAEKGLLWVGVNQGLIVTYPLPRLGGIPTVAGQACVSFHIHEGPVKHLHSFRISTKLFPQIETASAEHNEVKSMLNVDMFSDSISEVESSMEVVQQKPSSEPVYFLVDPNAENQYGGVSSYVENKDVLQQEMAVVDNDVKDEEKKHNEVERKGDPEPEPGAVMEEPRGALERDDEVSNKMDTLVDNKLTDAIDEFVPEVVLNEKEATQPTKPTRRDTYDSDDDITADQEFSFIENETNGYDLESYKPEQDFSIYIDKDKAVVKSTVNTMPVLKEGGFVEMMEQFEGFSLPPTSTSTPHKPDLEVPLIQSTLLVDEVPKEENGLNGKSLEVINEKEPQRDSAVVKVDLQEQGEGESKEEPTEKDEKEMVICTHDKTIDLCEDCEDNIFQTDSGYELPFQIELPPVTQPYSVVNKENQLLQRENSKNAEPSNPALESFYEQYKVLPLPKSPNNSVNIRSTSNPTTPKTPIGSYTDKGMYTPLLNSDNFSTSLTSTIGLRAYEKEISLSDSSLVRETNESYYASLVAVSKREEETRRDCLLMPSYVVSVGVGHVDLRKKVRPLSGLDIFKSFSGEAQEPLLMIWKLS